MIAVKDIIAKSEELKDLIAMYASALDFETMTEKEEKTAYAINDIYKAIDTALYEIKNME